MTEAETETETEAETDAQADMSIETSAETVEAESDENENEGEDEDETEAMEALQSETSHDAAAEMQNQLAASTATEASCPPHKIVGEGKFVTKVFIASIHPSACLQLFYSVPHFSSSLSFDLLPGRGELDTQRIQTPFRRT